MNRASTLIGVVLLLGGIGAAGPAAVPAMAQVACPAGYYYSPLYGCVPAGEVIPPRGSFFRHHYPDPVRIAPQDHFDRGTRIGSVGPDSESHPMPDASFAGHTAGDFHGGAFFGGSFGHGGR